VACTHEKPVGHKMCRACHAAYMREYRKVATTVAVRNAKKQGAEQFRVLVVKRFEELAEFELNGRAAAEIVRNITLVD
jgi:hypothetical protein